MIQMIQITQTTHSEVILKIESTSHESSERAARRDDEKKDAQRAHREQKGHADFRSILSRDQQKNAFNKHAFNKQLGPAQKSLLERAETQTRRLDASDSKQRRAHEQWADREAGTQRLEDGVAQDRGDEGRQYASHQLRDHRAHLHEKKDAHYVERSDMAKKDENSQKEAILTKNDQIFEDNTQKTLETGRMARTTRHKSEVAAGEENGQEAAREASMAVNHAHGQPVDAANHAAGAPTGDEPTGHAERRQEVARIAHELIDQAHIGADSAGRQIMLLQLDVPGRGPLHVRLRRRGDAFELRLRPEQKALARQLREQRETLRESAAARGVKFSAIEIV